MTKQYKFTYTYSNSYDVVIEATDREMAWEKFNHGKFDNTPVCIDSEMLENVEISEVEND